MFKVKNISTYFTSVKNISSHFTLTYSSIRKTHKVKNISNHFTLTYSSIRKTHKVKNISSHFTLTYFSIRKTHKVKNISNHFTFNVRVIFYERDNNKLKIVIVLVLAFLEILNIAIEQTDEIFSLKNAIGSY